MTFVNPGLTPLSRFIYRIGYNPLDSDEFRLQKALLVSGSFMFIIAGAVWGLAYLWLGEVLAGIIPLTYSVLASLSVVIFVLTRRYFLFRVTQLILILVLPFLLMVTLGGFINASAVIVWSLLCPLGALLFSGPRRALFWMGLYLILMLVSGLIQPYVALSNQLSEGEIIAFFVANLSAVSLIVFVLLFYFVQENNRAADLLRQERERSEQLLLNVLPHEVADRLKSGQKVIADHYECISVMFADLVGFTPLSEKLNPEDMIQALNEIYSKFDDLVEMYRLEKIRAGGDNYMVASGVPTPRVDHAQVLVQLALDMAAYLEERPPVEGHPIQFRFGINSGPVIAGVVGHHKFHYDVWGDAVNVASRMESHGQPGRVQITRATYDLVRDDFECERHGPVIIKGKGEMETWFVVRPLQLNPDY